VLTVYIDGVKKLRAIDAAFRTGPWPCTVGTTPAPSSTNVIVRPLPEPAVAETFGDGNFDGWTVVNQGTVGTSDWSAAGNILAQTGNMYSTPTTTASLPKKGTFAKYNAGGAWTNYQITCTMRSDAAGDMGIMFRVKDDNNYYRFSWSKTGSYARLIKMTNGTATLLNGATAFPYVTGQTYNIRIVAEGSALRVFINGVQKLAATNTGFTNGTIACYSWNNAGAYFDDIVSGRRITNSADRRGTRKPVVRPEQIHNGAAGSQGLCRTRFPAGPGAVTVQAERRIRSTSTYLRTRSCRRPILSAS